MLTFVQQHRLRGESAGSHGHWEYDCHARGQRFRCRAECRIEFAESAGGIHLVACRIWRHICPGPLDRVPASQTQTDNAAKLLRGPLVHDGLQQRFRAIATSHFKERSGASWHVHYFGDRHGEWNDSQREAHSNRGVKLSRRAAGYLRKFNKFKVERICPVAERIALVAVVACWRFVIEEARSAPTSVFSC
jgi:hypothetical protein